MTLVPGDFFVSNFSSVYPSMLWEKKSTDTLAAPATLLLSAE